MRALGRFTELVRRLSADIGEAMSAIVVALLQLEDRVATLETLASYIRLIDGEVIIYYRSGKDNYTEALRVRKDGSVVLSKSELATTSDIGFTYIPTCAGPPTGTPNTWRGLVPVVFDSADDRLYAYVGGAWKSVVLV